MIELKNVTKILKNKKVIDNITYNFEEGKVYGLYGINGSGKTMILRAIAGLLVPNSGDILINNKKLHKDISFPPNTGIVIENMELLASYTGKKNLEILASIAGKATEQDIDNALERVGLTYAKDIKVKKYSLGMKQRLNIAQAIFENQKIILLDEPTNALDKEGLDLIYNIIAEEKSKGAIIIIATHNKDALIDLCDTALEVKNGSI